MTEQDRNLNPEDSVSEAEDVLSTPRSEIEGVSIINSAASLKLFNNALDELAEADDPRIRNNAQRIAKMLADSEIGIICEEDLTPFDPEYSDQLIKTSQVILSNKTIPVFVISPTLNQADSVQRIVDKSGIILPFLDPEKIKDDVRGQIVSAIDTMVFAIETAERYQ